MHNNNCKHALDNMNTRLTKLPTINIMVNDILMDFGIHVAVRRKAVTGAGAVAGCGGTEVAAMHVHVCSSNGRGVK